MKIHDIFDFEKAKDEINVVYYDNLNSVIQTGNMFQILPNQGGISFPYDTVKVYFELISPTDIYKLHTIEVHIVVKLLKIILLLYYSYYYRFTTQKNVI